MITNTAKLREAIWSDKCELGLYEVTYTSQNGLDKTWMEDKNIWVKVAVSLLV